MATKLITEVTRRRIFDTINLSKEILAAEPTGDELGLLRQ